MKGKRGASLILLPLIIIFPALYLSGAGGCNAESDSTTPAGAAGPATVAEATAFADETVKLVSEITSSRVLNALGFQGGNPPSLELVIGLPLDLCTQGINVTEPCDNPGGSLFLNAACSFTNSDGSYDFHIQGAIQFNNCDLEGETWDGPVDFQMMLPQVSQSCLADPSSCTEVECCSKIDLTLQMTTSGLLVGGVNVGFNFSFNGVHDAGNLQGGLHLPGGLEGSFDVEHFSFTGEGEIGFICATGNNGKIQCIPDSDGDGLFDDKDNCPEEANPGQEDGDLDGIGDVCDINCGLSPPSCDSVDDCVEFLDLCQSVAQRLTDQNSAVHCETSSHKCKIHLIEPFGDDCSVLPPPTGGVCREEPPPGPGDPIEIPRGECETNDDCSVIYSPAGCDPNDVLSCQPLPFCRNGCCYDDFDTDQDGIPDAAGDNCREEYNPLQCDFDGDGVGDICDNCLEVFNPGQEDGRFEYPSFIYADSLGNECDDDDDNDGIPDVDDPCPLNADTDMTDSDGDGVPNVCDNCPDVSNPDQTDTDGDGFGDDCPFSPPPPPPPPGGSCGDTVCDGLGGETCDTCPDDCGVCPPPPPPLPPPP